MLDDADGGSRRVRKGRQRQECAVEIEQVVVGEILAMQLLEPRQTVLLPGSPIEGGTLAGILAIPQMLDQFEVEGQGDGQAV